VTSKLAVERYEPAARGEWDDAVKRARARHFLFERDYMDYHADRFADASLIVLRDGDLVAVLPGSRHDDDVVSHGGLTFGGLLSGPGMTVSNTVAALDAITATLRADGVRRLVYKAVPHIYHVAPAEEDLHALHAAGARLVRRDVSAAVAGGAAADYSEERRRAIRRGASAGLELGESGQIEAFMELVTEVLQTRHGVEPVHTPAEMRLLADRFPGRIRLWTASAGGEIVAGALIYETPVVAHAQYIANGPRGRDLGAGDVLFDHLLTAVYSDKWFDFGISNEREGELNAGLMRNKEGFGARAVVHDRYLLELS
jgi:Acetyltransferase (GNAT) domain